MLFIATLTLLREGKKMLKDAVAVLDIGSNKVTVMIGENGVNQTFIIHSSCEMPYAGYDENFFFSPSAQEEIGIEEAIKNAIDTVKRNSSIKINKIFVGVPGAFLKIVTKNHSNSYENKIKISQKEIERFKSSGLVGLSIQDYSVINSQVVYYVLSDGSKVANPLGKKSVNLNGTLSYSLCDNKFIKLIELVLGESGIDKVSFVPSSLAECLYLFSQEKRKTFNVLLDVGYMSSTLSVIYHNGLVYQKSFPYGGGTIAGYIFQALGFNDYKLFSVAEELVRKINFGLEGDETYQCIQNGRLYKYSATQINSYASEVIMDIAEEVSNSLEIISQWLPNGTRVNLTGGGISFIRGACGKLRDLLSRGVDIVSPKVPMFKQPNESSKLALLDYALNLSN